MNAAERGKAISSNISDREWRFDKDRVGEDQLEICFLYEYAREHAKSSKRWQKLTKQLKIHSSSKQTNKTHRNELLVGIRSIFGNRTTLPCFLQEDFVTTPWQALDEKLRRREAKEFNDERSRPRHFRESIRLTITLQRDLAEFAKAEVYDFDSWVFLDRCFHGEPNQREYGFFAINWNYTDGDLIAEFKKWLEEKRGNREDVESEQGKQKCRIYLNALGAKRLLDCGLTVPQAMDYTQQYLKDNKALYESARGWSKAKNEIVPMVLKRHFFAGPDRT